MKAQGNDLTVISTKFHNAVHEIAILTYKRKQQTLNINI